MVSDSLIASVNISRPNKFGRNCKGQPKSILKDLFNEKIYLFSDFRPFNISLSTHKICFPVFVSQQRGVDSQETLPYFPFRDDALLVWAVVKEFAQNYVNLWVLHHTSSCNMKAMIWSRACRPMFSFHSVPQLDPKFVILPYCGGNHRYKSGGDPFGLTP